MWTRTVSWRSLTASQMASLARCGDDCWTRRTPRGHTSLMDCWPWSCDPATVRYLCPVLFVQVLLFKADLTHAVNIHICMLLLLFLVRCVRHRIQKCMGPHVRHRTYVKLSKRHKRERRGEEREREEGERERAGNLSTHQHCGLRKRMNDGHSRNQTLTKSN